MLLLPSGVPGSSTFEAAVADKSTTHDESPVASGSSRAWYDLPWRTIVATIALIAIAYIASGVMVLILIAGFFGIVLNQPVRALQRRFSVKQGLAIGLVVGAMTIVLGLIALFVLPVRAQLVAVLTDLASTVEQALRGKGPIGNLTTKLHLVSVVRDHQQTLATTARSIDNSLPSVLSSLLGRY